MSSEISDDSAQESSDMDIGPRKRKLKSIPWESEEMCMYKRKLDQHFRKNAKRVSLRHMAPVRRDSEIASSRKKPTNAPNWACKC